MATSHIIEIASEIIAISYIIAMTYKIVAIPHVIARTCRMAAISHTIAIICGSGNVGNRVPPTLQNRHQSRHRKQTPMQQKDVPRGP